MNIDDMILVDVGFGMYEDNIWFVLAVEIDEELENFLARMGKAAGFELPLQDILWLDT